MQWVLLVLDNTTGPRARDEMRNEEQTDVIMLRRQRIAGLLQLPSGVRVVVLVRQRSIRITCLLSISTRHDRKIREDGKVASTAPCTCMNKLAPPRQVKARHPVTLEKKKAERKQIWLV